MCIIHFNLKYTYDINILKEMDSLLLKVNVYMCIMTVYLVSLKIIDNPIIYLHSFHSETEGGTYFVRYFFPTT